MAHRSILGLPRLPNSGQKNTYGRYWTAIWSRLPVVKEWETYDAETAVCAEIAATEGRFLVYGTILTWHADPGPDPKRKSPQWLEHHRAIFDHGDDWARLLREAGKGLPLVVCGDFNQTRDGSNAYCSKGGQSILILDEQLKRNRLACLSEEEFALSPDPRSGLRRHNIDHICATEGAFDVIGTGAWDHFTESGTYLSDHNGVYVDLTLAVAVALQRKEKETTCTVPIRNGTQGGNG